MSPEQISQLQNALKESVETQVKLTVNGKIDKMLTELQAHIKDDAVVAEKTLASFANMQQVMDTYIEQDTKEWERWKEEMTPVLKMGNSLSGFGKTTMYVVGLISAVGGAVALIVSAISKLK